MTTEHEGERVVSGPITDDDIGRVAGFLARTMDSGVTAQGWEQAMRPPWSVDQPNHGYMLTKGDEVVGAYLAIYSERRIEGRIESICNLAAWSVVEEERVHSVRLLRALLRQKQYHFTDLSPSGSVVEINEQLGFSSLDNRTELIPCLPIPPLPGRPRARILTGSAEIERALSDEERQIHLDHRDTAVHQVVIQARNGASLVLFRRERLKRLPLFATVLHVTDPDVFHAGVGALGAHLLVRYRIAGLLVEPRLVGGAIPGRSFSITPPRTRMYRSTSLDPGKIDYLYSELATVAW